MTIENLNQFRELQRQILARAHEVAEAIRPLTSKGEERRINITDNGCVNIKYIWIWSEGHGEYYDHTCLSDEEMVQPIEITLKQRADLALEEENRKANIERLNKSRQIEEEKALLAELKKKYE